MGTAAKELVFGVVVETPLDGLVCSSWNPRAISDWQLESLKRSLVETPELCWLRPVLYDQDGVVFAGNQRVRAARELGWRSIPAVRVQIAPLEAKRLALVDNNSWGRWVEPQLASILAELVADGIDLHLVGFESGEIDRLLAEIRPAADPDEIPDLPAGVPRSRPGEIIELGPHRLACGDCRDPGLLETLMGDELADLLLTDPPYGVAYVGKTKRGLTIRNDDAVGLPALLREAFAAADTVLGRSTPWYVFAPAGPLGTEFRLSLAEAGWQHRQTLTWVKNALVLGHSDFHYQHEDVLYGFTAGPGRPGRGGHKGSRWYGGNDQSSVLFADRPARSETHPTVKPVALLEQLLANSSRHNDVVFDPFAGSGSTMVAADRLGRRARLVELDPGYCDVIRARWEANIDGR